MYENFEQLNFFDPVKFKNLRELCLHAVCLHKNKSHGSEKNCHRLFDWCTTPHATAQQTIEAKNIPHPIEPFHTFKLKFYACNSPHFSFCK